MRRRAKDTINCGQVCSATAMEEHLQKLYGPYGLSSLENDVWV